MTRANACRRKNQGGDGSSPGFRSETKCWWGRAVPTPVHELALTGQPGQAGKK